MERDRKKLKLLFHATMPKPSPTKVATTSRAVRSRNIVARFKASLDDGSATKVSSSQTKLIAEEHHGRIKVRQLGPVLDRIPDDSPSLLVEVDDESSIMREIRDLKRRTSVVEEELIRRTTALEASNKKLEASNKKLEASDKKLEASDKKLAEFQTDAMEICVRAFLDKVLESFYIHAKKEGLGLAERAQWLKSQDAQEFAQGKSVMSLFGKQVQVSGRLLKLLKGMKYDSSLVSRTVAHSSRPYRVALALQDLDSYKTKSDYNWIFRKAFGMSPEQMVKKWETGQLDASDTTRFSLARHDPEVASAL